MSLSVDMPHCAHQRRVGIVAPRSESAIAPAVPATIITMMGVVHPASLAPTPAQAAPATAPSVPERVMPPDVPAGTFLPEIIRRGMTPLSVPISVDHVSAAEAARAPIPAICHFASGKRSEASAAATNTPPFAAT